MLTQDNCSLKLQLKIFSIQIILRTKMAIITAVSLSFQAALKCFINSYLISNQTKPIKNSALFSEVIISGVCYFTKSNKMTVDYLYLPEEGNYKTANTRMFQGYPSQFCQINLTVV